MTTIQSVRKAKKSPPNSPGQAGPRPVNGQRKAEACSRVSNGRDVLPGVDGRSAVARRYYDIQTAIVIDQGGPEQLSEARLQLIRRFSAAAVIAEMMEADLANGKQIDIQEHALLCSTLVRCARQIGIGRVAKDITPSLRDIIQEGQNEYAPSD